MVNIGLLIFCFVFGIILRQSGRLPENAPAALNGFIIHISLPAVILLYIHRLPIDSSLIYAVVAPWILFAIGLSLFVTVAKLANWSAQTTGGLILSASLGKYLISWPSDGRDVLWRELSGGGDPAINLAPIWSYRLSALSWR